MRGELRIEWVDGSDAEDDPRLPRPNLGWFGVHTDQPVGTGKLVQLLRAVADHLEASKADVEDQRLAVGPKTLPPHDPRMPDEG
jgi:hypothetical protein